MLIPAGRELLGVAIYGSVAFLFAAWLLGPVLMYVCGWYWTHDSYSTEGDVRWAEAQESPFAETEASLVELGFRPAVKVSRGSFAYFGKWWRSQTIHVFFAEGTFAEVYRLRPGERPRIGLTTLFEDDTAVATSLMPEATFQGARYKIVGKVFESPREMFDSHRAWVALLVQQGKRVARVSPTETLRRAGKLEFESEQVLETQRSLNLELVKSYLVLLVLALLGTYSCPDPPTIKILAALAFAGATLWGLYLWGWITVTLETWSRRGI